MNQKSALQIRGTAMQAVSRLRKRPGLLLGLLGVVLLLLGGGVLLWVILPHHRISRASYEMIRQGMTQAEVEAVMGVPPGEYKFWGTEVSSRTAIAVYPPSAW